MLGGDRAVSRDLHQDGHGDLHAPYEVVLPRVRVRGRGANDHPDQDAPSLGVPRASAVGAHVDGRSQTNSPRTRRGEAEEEEGRNRVGEAGGNRHAVVAAAAEDKHHDEEVAAAEAGDRRDVVVEVGDHHGAAAAAHTCRTVEGEGNGASRRVEEAGKGECHCRCGFRARAFQSGDEGRRGARHLDDEDEDPAHEDHEAHEALVPLQLHRMTTPHP